MPKAMRDPLCPALADDSLLGTSGEGHLCRGGASGTPSSGDDIDSIDCGAGITSADILVT